MDLNNMGINELSFEVIIIILKHSSFRSIVRLAQANRKFRDICQTTDLKRIIHKKLGPPISIKHLSAGDPVCPGSIFKRTAETYVVPYKSKYIIDCFGRKSGTDIMGAKVRRIKYISGDVAYCGERSGMEVIKHVCQDPCPCYCQNEWRFITNENKSIFLLNA